MSARAASTLASKLASVDAVVVGGGPCGVAVVGNLLEHLGASSSSQQKQQKQQQLWVDPVFGAGRMGAHYGEVPSNTNVDLFVQFVTTLAPFRRILETTPAPNAITALRSLPQDQGCRLQHAVDLCRMLTEGVTREFSQRVQQHRGRVTSAVLHKDTDLWTVTVDGRRHVQTPRLVLCTGSSPTTTSLPAAGPGLVRLDLDTALKPSQLAETLDPAADATVAVVGASHSAVLVLMNLHNLATTTHPRLRVQWLTRHTALRYAVPMPDNGGWILHDNTGLKGQAAQWARANLEGDVFRHSPISRVITRLHTPPDQEDQIYRDVLPRCSHIVQAIGYQRNPLPTLSVAESAGAGAQPLAVEHDALTGRFTSVSSGKTHVPGLFGAGIAFPERVTDPAGNVESSVGMWKFMRFLKRVVPEWVV